MKCYARRYLAQFGTIVGPVPVGHTYQGRVVTQHPALPWFYGVSSKDSRASGWDELWRCSTKTRHISIVVSDKNWRPRYRARLDFVKQLREALGADLDVLGRGVQPVDDKAEVISPYRYHVVLENNLVDHFWTEKLADAYLGEAFPIYSGGGQLDQYFDPKSFATIDLTDTTKAVAEVQKILEADPAARVQPLLRKMHERVMTEHNFFAVCERIIQANTSQDKPLLSEPVFIRPSISYSLKRSLHRAWRNARTSLGLRRMR